MALSAKDQIKSKSNIGQNEDVVTPSPNSKEQKKDDRRYENVDPPNLHKGNKG